MSQQVTMPDGSVHEFPDGVSPEDMQKAITTDQTPASKESGDFQQTAQGAGGEVLASMVTGAIAQPIAGLAGMAQGAANVVRSATGRPQGPSAADRVRSTEEALTYQPRSKEGQQALQTVTAPFAAASGALHKAGESVAEATGSPALGAATETIPQGALALLAPEARGAFASMARGVGRGAGSAATAGAAGASRVASGAYSALERAKGYVHGNTNLDWNSLPQGMRDTLTKIAKDSRALGKLDPKAIERQATLARAGVTKATKGQLTRDPVQQRAEMLTKAAPGGQALRDLDIENNKILTDNVQALRGKAKAEGPLQTGKSVQGALRARLAAAKKNVKGLYEDARASGELQAPVNIDPLVDYLKKHSDPAEVAYVQSRLKGLGAIKEETTGGITVEQNRPLSLEELEGIRRAAVAKGKAGGTAGHYASEVKGVIDDITKGAGGEKYQLARKARAQMGEEFERTKAVADLVKNRKMSADRAVKLEDTWRRSVLSGGLEDLQNVRSSLIKSGKQGRQAWEDLRGATADYILNKATGGGKLGLKNQAGDLNATWDGLRRAVQDVGPDKLELLFGKAGAQKLNDIVESAQILKTEAPAGWRGSQTFANFISLMDKLGAVPIVGRLADVAAGTAKGIAKLKEAGKSGREARTALKTPLEEATPKRPGITLESLKRAPAAVPVFGGGSEQ